MNYTGPIYRPPYEARSLLLQVTAGCSHNKCSFCTMYRSVPFRTEHMETIENDLREAKGFAPHTKRVFLENGDPFALGADKLEAIALKIREYLPEVETIAMYAAVGNIRGKTDAELRRLRKLGINELNIGVESGLDEALALMNKGYDAKEALYELKRLRSAGIDYGANIIFGCAGKGKNRENAEATAKLLNETSPYLVFTGTIHAEPGCPLYDDMRSGRFTEGTFGEYLDEEELLISLLDIEGSCFFGLHPSNVAPLYGRLNEDRERLLLGVREKRAELADRLDEYPERAGEGGII
ncbi:MAG: radical SAM protein [Oscillospiraceae bacterium]|nr:radical SAM protein [Oscillospiraceae bacterium]